VPLPIRITVRVDLDDGSQHDYEVRTPDAVPAPGGFWPEGVVTEDVAHRMEHDRQQRQERDFLLRLLRLAAEDDDLNPDDLEFAVIAAGTTVGVGDANGPLRGQLVNLGEVSYRPFSKGEILILPKGGHREPFGAGRSTAKYDVVEERFGHDWEAAKRRSGEVKATRPVDGFARPPAR
jgi:hypothetical protein